MTVAEDENELLAPANPHSLLNLLDNSPKFSRNLVLAQNSKYADCTDEQFRAHFGHDKQFKNMRLLRLSFWNEHEQACRQNRKMNLTNVFSGICSAITFNRYINEMLYVAYMTTRPVKLSLVQQDLIYLAYQQMEDILSMNHIDSRGNPDTKLIREKLNILKNLEDRHSGGVIERKQVQQETRIVAGVEGTDKLKNEDEYRRLLKEITDLKEKLGPDALADIEVAAFKVVDG